MLDDLLGADPASLLRRETRIYYLGDFPREHYADGFLRAAGSLINTPAGAPS